MEEMLGNIAGKLLILQVPSTTIVDFAASIDQDQTTPKYV